MADGRGLFLFPAVGYTRLTDCLQDEKPLRNMYGVLHDVYVYIMVFGTEHVCDVKVYVIGVKGLMEGMISDLTETVIKLEKKKKKSMTWKRKTKN